MKKLFSIGVLTLVMLTSCQNSNDEITPKPEANSQASNNVGSKSNTEDQEKELNSLGAVEIDDELSKYAIVVVENAVNGNVSMKINAYLMCHGDYNASISWSYVQVNVDGEINHRLVRRYRTPGGGVLTTVYKINEPADCGSTLFW